MLEEIAEGDAVCERQIALAAGRQSASAKHCPHGIQHSGAKAGGAVSGLDTCTVDLGPAVPRFSRHMAGQEIVGDKELVKTGSRARSHTKRGHRCSLHEK